MSKKVTPCYLPPLSPSPQPPTTYKMRMVLRWWRASCTSPYAETTRSPPTARAPTSSTGVMGIAAAAAVVVVVVVVAVMVVVAVVAVVVAAVVAAAVVVAASVFETSARKDCGRQTC